MIDYVNHVLIDMQPQETDRSQEMDVMNTHILISMEIIPLDPIKRSLMNFGQFKHKTSLLSSHVSLIDLNSMATRTQLIMTGEQMKCILLTIMPAIGLTVMSLAMMTLMTITSVTPVYKKINSLLMETTIILSRSTSLLAITSLIHTATLTVKRLKE